MPQLRFLFDQHVNARALKELQARGADAVHVAEVDLSTADDPAIFAWARDHQRIVVTRNYQDFAPLVQAYAEKGVETPGVLFLATSVPQAHAGHHVRTMLEWIQGAEQTGRNPVASTFGWLR